MKAITVRDMPPALEEAVLKRAQREGMSLNRTVILMLEEASGLSEDKKPKLNHDFDKFAGTWTAEEADDFDRRVAHFEEIDWEMWK